MKYSFFLITFCLMIISSSSIAQEAATNEETKPAAEKVNKRPAEPDKKPEPFDDVDVETMAQKCVTLESEKGNISMEMFPESAPESVRNFLNLAATGALDTTTFSRVVPDFVIQGGNLYTSEKLTTDLKWRALRTIPDEPSLIKHERGIVSMARGEEPNTASTSFFILVKAADTLDGTFAAFGRVVSGMEVVDEINKMPVENEKPKDAVRITKASVVTCQKETAPNETADENAEP